MSSSRKLVIWTCPDKHPCVSGFRNPQDSALMFCNATIGKNEHGDRIACRKVMTVAYDERPKTDGPLGDSAREDEKLIRIMRACRMAADAVAKREMSADEIVGNLGIALKGIRKVKR